MVQPLNCCIYTVQVAQSQRAPPPASPASALTPLPLTHGDGADDRARARARARARGRQREPRGVQLWDCSSHLRCTAGPADECAPDILSIQT